MNYNNIETSSHAKTKKEKNINQIINKLNLYNNCNNKEFNFIIIKARKIFLIGILILIILCPIIFVILYFSQDNNEIIILFNKKINNTNIDGFFNPKDNFLNLTYKKCSIENCKKCYGNSFNDTCISCLNSFKAILNDKNKIISCVKGSQNENDKNITINESFEINLTDNNSIKIKDESFNDSISTISQNIQEMKNSFVKEIKSDRIKEISELLIEKINNTFTENESNLMSQRVDKVKSKPSTMFELTFRNSIINCEPGYYWPEGGDECKQCSINGCEICHGNDTTSYCELCFSKYILKNINSNQICIECENNCIECDQITFRCLKCESEYIVYEGKCYAYSFETIYHIMYNNITLHLINLDPYYIDKILVEDKLVQSTNNYTFITNGHYRIYFFLKNNPYSFEYLFSKHYFFYPYYYHHDYYDFISVNFTSHFKTNNITNLRGMFSGCEYLISLDLSHFNTSNVIDMAEMFENCGSLNSLDLSNFNVQNVRSFAFIFFFCSSLTTLVLPNAKSNNKIENTINMFSQCKNLKFLDLSNIDITNVEYMTGMFNGCSSLKKIDFCCFKETINGTLIKNENIYIKKVKLINYMFRNCKSLQYINLTNWNLDNVHLTDQMFSNCVSLETVIFGKFQVHDVKNMGDLFYNCEKLKMIDLSRFKNTSNLVYMNNMFRNCKSLKEIDLSHFDISHVEDISYMFSGCSSLIDINFNFSTNNNISNMHSLFFGCSNLTSINLHKYNTKKAVDMTRMFYNCSSLINLNLYAFNTSKVQIMNEMFYGCSSLVFLNISTFEGNLLKNCSNMFHNVNKSIIYANNDFKLILRNYNIYL